MTANQEFGGRHTKTKLSIISAYLPAYTTALKGQLFKLHYIDAFAGTGFCKIAIDGRKTTIPGSASIAVECDPPFHSLTFIEETKKKCDALRRLAANKLNLNIEVRHGDANTLVPNRVNELNGWNDRAIIFLDPFGMSVHWDTLKVIASSKKVDVWFLFSLSGLYRQATVNPEKITEDKRIAITRCLGTDEWRNVFYGKPPIPPPPPTDNDFFPDHIIAEHEKKHSSKKEKRLSSPTDMLSWIAKRMEEIFSYVHPPRILYQEGNNTPIFALFFMMSNDSGPAIGLAKRLVKGVFESVDKNAKLGEPEDTPPTPCL